MCMRPADSMSSGPSSGRLPTSAPRSPPGREVDLIKSGRTPRIKFSRKSTPGITALALEREGDGAFAYAARAWPSAVSGHATSSRSSLLCSLLRFKRSCNANKPAVSCTFWLRNKEKIGLHDTGH